MKPAVASIVHYVSYGTPGGEYTSQCRAAIVTEVGAWVTVETALGAINSPSEGRPIRQLTQWFYDDAVALTVCNPTGLFFNGAGPVACKYHDGAETPGAPDCIAREAHGNPFRYCACGWSEAALQGGTWHWPTHA